ncbi:uncharacterized protein IUM83_15276 [Phytophthora cinnamomi]|uniref:uncharacterized protein n=1 Tax=Phytophthora cinnamomi TaxID=4785 RepID=UPI00355AC4FB|nr:hypothetical protein IUM83_15276 [Phytophthora cinnamomi]
MKITLYNPMEGCVSRVVQWDVGLHAFTQNLQLRLHFQNFPARNNRQQCKTSQPVHSSPIVPTQKTQKPAAYLQRGPS